MSSRNFPVLFVTANVGSIFEDPSVMLKIWTEEFLSTVAKLDPKFIALHCQEVGGKNYEQSMKYVEDFVKLLMTSEELRLFDRVRIFIDEDYSSAENFTALGNIYFIHESVEEVLIWDFKDMEFVYVEGAEIHTGNIENVVTKEKAKYPQDFFPECKWSRKGFLRTRWSISGTVFDLINIHLFHDASNFIAMEEYPSVYCNNRRRALEHTLQRFHSDRYGPAPYFVFGDFNFRTDTNGVVKKLTEGLTTTKIPHHKNSDSTKLQFHNNDSKVVLTVGKKEFNHSDHQDVFLSSDSSWLQSYDKELEAFANQLFEFPVNFPASYPFEEKVSCATTYMQTRCPAWCDRVLLSHTAKTLIDNDQKIEYNIIGRETCMGDHKPVFLRLNMRADTGIVSCCEHLNARTPAACKCCQNYASIKINIIECEYISGQNSFADVDRTLLHEPFTKDMLMHDPYTPESIESHSPLPNDRTDQRINPLDYTNNRTLRNQSVSPSILKSRLEVILKTETEPYPKFTENITKKFNKSKQNRQLTKSQSQHLDDNEIGHIRTRCLSESSQKNHKSKLIYLNSDQNMLPLHNHRTRCLSESSKKNSKVKLICANHAQSMIRLQSHHSSSDEDWFEFEDTTPTTITTKNNIDIQETDNDVFAEVTNLKIRTDSDEIFEDRNKNIEKKNKIDKKHNCCCVLS